MVRTKAHGMASSRNSKVPSHTNPKQTQVVSFLSCWAASLAPHSGQARRRSPTQASLPLYLTEERTRGNEERRLQLMGLEPGPQISIVKAELGLPGVPPSWPIHHVDLGGTG